jgi:DNA invertase Pin-like site-specific DNA recombinase
MNIGYARVSVDRRPESINGQKEELAKVCGKRIYEETASGGRWDRPVLQEILRIIAPGDVLVVYKLDRLTRSLRDLLLILEKLEQRGARFQSLTENLDTISPGGRAMMQLLGVFAEFEREMIRERVNTGLKRARARGKVGGRPRALKPEAVDAALRMVEEGTSQSEVARILKVHRAIICRLVKERRVLAK